MEKTIIDAHSDEQKPYLFSRRKIEYTVSENGSARIDVVYVWEGAPNLLAIGIQTRKRCVVLGMGGGDDDGPSVSIATNEDAPLTEVSFPQFKGWSVWSAQASKYTIHLCLTKDRK